ncbi:MAG: hypothetical protein AAFP76_08450 [Bacteroidota bacterium]
MSGVYNDSALFYAKQSKSEALDAKDKKQLITAYYDIGNVYKRTGHQDEARDHYQKGIDLATEIESKNQLGYLYQAMGSHKMIVGAYREAIDYFERALQISINEGLNKLAGKNYLDIANCLEKLGQLEEMRSTIEKAAPFLTNDKEGIIHPELPYFLARIEFLTDNFELAEQKALESITLAKKFNSRWNLYRTYNLLSKIGEKTHNFEMAYNYKIEAQRVHGFMREDLRANSVQSLDFKLELDALKAQNEKLDKVQWFWLPLGILTLMSVLLLTLYLKRQRKALKITKAIHEAQFRLVDRELSGHTSEKEIVQAK